MTNLTAGQRFHTLEATIARSELKPRPYLERVTLSKHPRFKETNMLWNEQRFNSTRRVGHMAKMFREHKPKSPQDFFEIYMTFGIGYYAVMALAIEFRDALANAVDADGNPAPMERTREEAFQYVLIRLIDQTYRGLSGEKSGRTLLRNLIQTKGAEAFDGVDVQPDSFVQVREATDDEDRNWAYDIAVLVDGIIVLVLQAKPPSYLPLSGLTPELVIAHAQNEAKHRKFTEQTGIPVKYVLTNDLERGVLRMIDHPYYEQMKAEYAEKQALRNAA